MKVYDKVKLILEEEPATRENDRLLIWRVWERQGLANSNYIPRQCFLFKATSPETVRRVRQKIQERHSELRPSSPVVIAKRRQKQASKGTFIYREPEPLPEPVQEDLFDD
jgi:hypothetical protein